MKSSLSVVFSFIALFSSQAEQSVTLAWDQNPETDIGGYIVYYGVSSRNYTNAVNVGNVTTNTVASLVDGVTYFFAVTAYNTNGLESDFSDEVSYARPGTWPAVFTLAPLLSRSNVVLRGQANPLPDLVWFEWAVDADRSNRFRLVANSPTNGTYWANLNPVPLTNMVFWFVGSNSTALVTSPERTFSTIPPKVPKRLRMEIKLAKSGSLQGPWGEAMTASVMIDLPQKEPQQFYRSLLTWTPEYEP